MKSSGMLNLTDNYFISKLSKIILGWVFLNLHSKLIDFHLSFDGLMSMLHVTWKTYLHGWWSTHIHSILGCVTVVQCLTLSSHTRAYSMRIRASTKVKFYVWQRKEGMKLHADNRISLCCSGKDKKSCRWKHLRLYYCQHAAVARVLPLPEKDIIKRRKKKSILKSSKKIMKVSQIVTHWLHCRSTVSVCCHPNLLTVGISTWTASKDG